MATFSGHGPAEVRVEIPGCSPCRGGCRGAMETYLVVGFGAAAAVVPESICVQIVYYNNMA